MNATQISVAERFAANVQVSNGCWKWIGQIDRHGYGLMVTKRGRLAHRLSYELHVGPIPDGLVIDHLCRIRNCVNPAHLEAVTAAENVNRGLRSTTKACCIRGHSLSEPNLVAAKAKKGIRNCLACARAIAAVHKHGGDVDVVADVKYSAIMPEVA